MSHVNLFQRRLKGCPDSGYPPNVTCSEGRSMFDAKEWRTIQEKAHTLFAAEVDQ